MALLLVNVALAAVPSVILVIYFYRRDSQKREPVSLIWKTFLVGFLSVIPTALAEQVTETVLVPFGGQYVTLVRSFIVAGLLEELSKFLVVFLFIYHRSEFDEVTDGIVYTITAGLGFAFFENILYSAGPTSVILLRGVTAVPLHAVTAGIMGYFIGRSRFLPRPIFVRGIAFAALIHGLYDLLLFTGTWAAFLVVPLILVSFRILQRLWQKALELDKEAGRS
jgi:RsiW-degrading membrane proteinase PrsW (M82 family)